jgi:hypothetical protein
VTKSNKQTTGIVARMRAAPRYIGIPVGLGLILGGTVLAPLPIFGVWMFPVGIAILAQHSPWADRMARRLYWWKLMFLRWSVRRGFLRMKRKAEREPSPDGN